MSVLVDQGQRSRNSDRAMDRSIAARAVGPDQRARAPHPARVRRVGEAPHPVRMRRAGETRRPPTRARVVAGRSRTGAVDCGPRRVMPRWPWLVAAALAVALVVIGLGVFAGSMGPSVPARTATVTVGEGQTLWDIARQYAPDADPNAVVTRIEQLNDMTDDSVFAGLPLTVPVDSAPPAGSR